MIVISFSDIICTNRFLLYLRGNIELIGLIIRCLCRVYEEYTASTSAEFGVVACLSSIEGDAYGWRYIVSSAQFPPNKIPGNTDIRTIAPRSLPLSGTVCVIYIYIAKTTQARAMRAPFSFFFFLQNANYLRKLAYDVSRYSIQLILTIDAVFFLYLLFFDFFNVKHMIAPLRAMYQSLDLAKM